MTLTQERLKEVLHYNKKTGIFTWKIRKSSHAAIGEKAGSLHKKTNRIRIRIDKKTYFASRLAWLYVKGYFPKHEIDHKNRISSDDSWENLREVTHQYNMRNRSIHKNNTSGISGVGWDKTKRTWRSCIYVNKERIFLGRFKNLDDAVKARWEAEIKYEYPNYNTSSAYTYLLKKDIIKE